MIRRRVAASTEQGRALRFLASGAFNTLLTYALYLVALRFMRPGLAYTLVYVIGIALAYVLNRGFVFRSHAGWRSAAAMPAIYLLQYLLSLGVITLWVWLELPAGLAPLPAIVLCMPVTYLLTRASFTRWKKNSLRWRTTDSQRDCVRRP
jgi:putative flippase GtrA